MTRFLAPAQNPPAPPAAVTVTPLLSRTRLWLWVITPFFLLLLYFPGYYYGVVDRDLYWLPLFSRWEALAIFALSVDLVWGYTGLLSLGQGLYFGLGGYLLAYYLSFQEAAANARDGVAGVTLTDYMYRCGLSEFPVWLKPLASLPVTVALILVLPGLLAFLFGWVVFRMRIKGVFFALVTQALVLAIFFLVDNQQAYTGGVVGMPGLPWLTIFGFRFAHFSVFLLIASVLSLSFMSCLWLTGTKFGRVLTAIREDEARVLALGYNTAFYKTALFTLAGFLAGIAGALYTASERTIGARDTFGMAFSIEIVILVAVGGRGTLFGPVIGTLLVLYGKTYANNEYKQSWPLMLGALFIGVVVFLPDGLIGLVRRVWNRLAKQISSKPKPLSATEG